MPVRRVLWNFVNDIAGVYRLLFYCGCPSATGHSLASVLFSLSDTTSSSASVTLWSSAALGIHTSATVCLSSSGTKWSNFNVLPFPGYLCVPMDHNMLMGCVVFTSLPATSFVSGDVHASLSTIGQWVWIGFWVTELNASTICMSENAQFCTMSLTKAW